MSAPRAQRGSAAAFLAAVVVMAWYVWMVTDLAAQVLR